MADIVAFLSATWSLMPFYLAWWGCFVDPDFSGGEEVRHDG